MWCGVDYETIIRKARSVDRPTHLIWDGGNNDLPFYKPDLHIVIADPLRAGHEVSYYPGGTNLRMADIVIINKISSAKKKDIDYRPKFDDLKSSGAYEEVADLVLLMHRESVYHNETPYRDVVEINVAKQRNGPTGTVFFNWEPSTLRLVERFAEMEI